MGKSHVTIIGGGVAGLAAALRLGRSGQFAPLVLEREEQPGGLARSLHFKGISTDLGPHRLHTELPEIEALVSEVCAPSLYTVKRKSRIFLRGKYIDYPPSPVGASLHLGPFRMMRFGLGMLAEKLKSPPATETYESIMRAAFGAPLYNFMLRPYTAKVWKTDPAQIHPDTARVRVSAGSLVKMAMALIRREKRGSESSLKEFRYVRGGIETLVRHLSETASAAGAEVRLASPAAGIDLVEKPGGWRAVAVRAGKSVGARILTDNVISTAPLPILLGELLPKLEALDEARRAAEGLVYLNIIFVLIIVKRKVISGDNWLYFPDPEFVFNRAYESKSFDPDMGPEDKSVLCVELTTRPGDAVDSDSDENIAAETVRQMASTGLFAESEVDEKIVYRLKYGYPLYSLDYAERLEKVFDGLARIENLLTCGRQGLFNHNNTDHSMLMGLRAADALIEDPAVPPAARWRARLDEFKRFRIVD